VLLTEGRDDHGVVKGLSHCWRDSGFCVGLVLVCVCAGIQAEKILLGFTCNVLEA
jgi:hypothetical protein